MGPDAAVQGTIQAQPPMASVLPDGTVTFNWPLIEREAARPDRTPLWPYARMLLEARAAERERRVALAPQDGGDR